MPYFFNFNFFACLCLLLCLGIANQAVAQPLSSPQYNLAISFDIDNNQVIGTAKIVIPKETPVFFSLTQLTVTGAFIQQEEGVEKELYPQDNQLNFSSSSKKRTLFISYIKDVRHEYSNLLSDNGISLTTNWYPYPSESYIFSLSAQLPNNFSGISQSDSFPLETLAGITKSHWSQPTQDIYFNAGPYVMSKLRVRDNLYVYSMFFKEDKELAQGYLTAASAYIKKYEKEIATYPYAHYVIVANRLPTGYGMPTFTLLGQMVLRLPFIKSSSLGHEILHSWFGNDVEVDYEDGNWCEGLTSFLADHAYRDAEGKGVEDRKDSLIKYHSYVNNSDTKPFTMKDFKSASHNQPMADAKRAVGYNGGAFLFHELREYLGTDTFTKGIQDFYLKNKSSAASWNDLQTSFDNVSNLDLNTVFTSRLNMTYAPEIRAENISVDSRSGIHLNFTLTQQSDEMIPMQVPILVKTMSGSHIFKQKLESSSQNISLALPDRPLEFIIDPEYTLLRTLSNEEQTPVWSRFLGAKNKLIVLADNADREKYQPILTSLQKYEPKIVTADDVTNKELSENNLLFLGPNQLGCRSILGQVNHDKNSVTIDVRNNPLHPGYVAVIISDNSTSPSPSIARRLKHYGKYSHLVFNGDGSVTKKTTKSSDGIHYELERLPKGGVTQTLSDFDQIINSLLAKKVIYIGETHNSLPDHLLQLRIIEALYQKDPRLAIGMEMFPVSSQPSLDRYTKVGSVMDEKTFLKQSDYYNVWRYDYRLFRDILNFARSKHLPIRGLNLDRKIVSDVYRSGNMDGLSDETIATLPTDRNLDLPGYQERLTMVHNAHLSGSHGQGASSGFIQAQGLWDETMASNIVSFLEDHPDYRMVVIAGNQHTRKDSGIPPRVAARISVDQASLINVYEDAIPHNLRQTTDYYFFSDNSSLPETPKIGIVLSPMTEESTNKGLIIDQISPHGKAGDGGLKQGDLLIGINQHPIENMADLRIAMLDAKEGDIVKVKVLRGIDQKEHHTLKVELTIPNLSKMPIGHP